MPEFGVFQKFDFFEIWKLIREVTTTLWAAVNFDVHFSLFSGFSNDLGIENCWKIGNHYGVQGVLRYFAH